MERINLPDGGWFDPSQATAYDEDTRFNGQNRISVATGSQWEHERLYRTRKDTWILQSWSQWQGSAPSFAVVDDAEARRWLLLHDHDVEAIFPGAMAAAEI